MKQLLLIVNIRAGKADAKTKYIEVIDIFIKGGYEVSVHIPQYHGEITRIVRERGAAFDVIVVSGGDGTINEAINGIMELEKRPYLGYMPSGTTNDYGKTLGISENIIDAALSIVNGKPYALDVGVFNERYFAYVAGFGAFTHVSYETPQLSKNVLGRAAYIIEGVKAISSIRPIATRFEHEGKMVEGDFIVGLISNSNRIGGIPFRNISDSSLNDGLLEVTMIRMPSNALENVELAGSLFRLDFEDNASSIFFYRTPSIDLEFDEEISWTVDGEYAGTYRKVHIALVHSAVEMLLVSDPSVQESSVNAMEEYAGGGSPN